MKSLRILSCLLLIPFCLSIAVGCQSGTTDTPSGSGATSGVAVNPAMSAKQRAIIAKHHQDN